MADSDLKLKREKLKSYYKAHGSENMTDCELLEAALTMSLSKFDAEKTAKSLMKEYCNFRNIFFLSPKQLLRADNVDLTAAVYLTLINDIKAKIEYDKNEHITDFTNGDNIIEFSKNMLSVQSVERVIFVSLDDKKRLINAGFISKGNANFASVMPTDISGRIVDDRPKYVFVAHNHLTGSCEPSTSDVNFTMNLFDWLSQFEIELIDHVIICQNGEFSMVQDDNYSFIFNKKG